MIRRTTAVLVLALALIACGGGNGSSSSTNAGTGGAETPADAATVGLRAATSNDIDALYAVLHPAQTALITRDQVKACEEENGTSKLGKVTVTSETEAQGVVPGTQTTARTTEVSMVAVVNGSEHPAMVTVYEDGGRWWMAYDADRLTECSR